MAEMTSEQVVLKCQQLRALLTDSFYRLERAYNTMPPEFRDWWCNQAQVDVYHISNNRRKKFSELTDDERQKLSDVLMFISLFVQKLPKSLNKREFFKVTRQ